MVKLTKKKFIKIIKGGAKTNPVKPKNSIFSRLFSKKNTNLKKFKNEKAIEDYKKIIKDYKKAIYTLYNNTYRTDKTDKTDINDNVANIFNDAVDILTIEYSEKLPKDIKLPNEPNNQNELNEPNETNNIMKLNKIKDDIIINKYEYAFGNIFKDYKKNIQKEYESQYKKYYNSFNNISLNLKRQGKSNNEISYIFYTKIKDEDIKFENMHIYNLHNKDKDLIKQFSAILTKDTKDPQNLENLGKLKKAKDDIIITDYNDKMNSTQNPNNNADSINEKMTKLKATYEKLLGINSSVYLYNKSNPEKLNIQDKTEFIKKSQTQSTIVEENFGGGYRKKHKKNKKNKKTLIIK